MHTLPDFSQESAGDVNKLATDHMIAPCQEELESVLTVAEQATPLRNASSSMVSQLPATSEPGAGVGAQVVDQALQDSLIPDTQSHLLVPSTPLLQEAPDMQHLFGVRIEDDNVIIAERACVLSSHSC
jgi:hypothetical protein